jgi:hypothetical protein
MDLFSSAGPAPIAVASEAKADSGAGSKAMDLYGSLARYLESHAPKNCLKN